MKTQCFRLTSIAASLALSLIAASPSAQSVCTAVTLTRSPTNPNAAAGNFDATGGTGFAYVNTSEPGCTWTAVGPTWVTFPNGASGAGSGWLKYAVAPATETRQMSVTVQATQSASFNVLQTTGSPHGNGTMQSPAGWTASPSTAVVAQPFKISGFSIDTRATSGPGISGVDIYWVDNTGFHPLGSATYGLPHPHAAENLGSEFLNSGYEMWLSGIPAGGPGSSVSIQAFGRSTVDGTTVGSGATRVTIIEPRLTLAPETLQFGATPNGASALVTPDQTIDLTGIGWHSGWRAHGFATSPWVGSGTSGTGPGSALVRVPPTPIPPPGTLFGQIRLEVPDLGREVDVLIRLESYPAGTTSPPYGFFDAPPSPTTGAVPLTGWALDDIAVSTVAIYRNRTAQEAGNGLVFVGNGSFVDGARPDVAAAFPEAPLKTRAGWGYMLLSNALPGGGNGTFTFHAYAVDFEGKQSLIGSRDVTLANTAADAPFGALDFPGPGETVSGTYTFTGWVVSPQPTQINWVGIYLDGQPIGLAQYGLSRPDVAALFSGPDAPVDAAAAGFRFTIDTRGLANGLHTIAVVGRNNALIFGGFGSRFFTVRNP